MFQCPNCSYTFAALGQVIKCPSCKEEYEDVNAESLQEFHVGSFMWGLGVGAVVGGALIWTSLGRRGIRAVVGRGGREVSRRVERRIETLEKG